MEQIWRMPSTRKSTGQLQNLMLIRTEADGTGNVVQHPHITSSQEQRGLIQNRRQRLGWAGCQVHHLSSSQGSNTHSFSLCFSVDPTEPLAKVGRLSVCCLWWWICHVSYTQHHKHKPCWSQEGPDAQQDSTPHQLVFPPRKALPLLRAELAKHPTHPLAGSPCAQLSAEPVTEPVWDLSSSVPWPWGKQLQLCKVWLKLWL